MSALSDAAAAPEDAAKDGADKPTALPPTPDARRSLMERGRSVLRLSPCVDAAGDTHLRDGQVYPLRPVVKEYAWGMRGSDSRVARYAHEAGALSYINPSAPYAELWLGTHPSGPATLEDGTPLSDICGELPFLMKILSAGKALSIQAHPDKGLAEQLHKDNPDKYKDNNHKPEMAIALTPFEAMCGFRHLNEITKHVSKHPEFAACLSDEAKLQVFMAKTDEEKRLALRALFTSYMECDSERAAVNLKLLLSRLRRENRAGVAGPHDEPPWERKASRAILRLAQQFPGDVGAMAPLFLNYLLIAPGESFFMAANEPHAYVAGEIIECMACSDNVVRAGLTPKFKDVDNLVNMLTYSMGGPTINIGDYEEDGRTVRYTPPVAEFEVSIITVRPGDTHNILPLDVPSILIVIEGAGLTGTAPTNGESSLRRHRYELRPGRSLYLSEGNLAVTLHVDANQKGPLRVAVAHSNLRYDPASPSRGVRKHSGSVDFADIPSRPPT